MMHKRDRQHTAALPSFMFIPSTIVSLAIVPANIHDPAAESAK